MSNKSSQITIDVSTLMSGLAFGIGASVAAGAIYYFVSTAPVLACLVMYVLYHRTSNAMGVAYPVQASPTNAPAMREEVTKDNHRSSGENEKRSETHNRRKEKENERREHRKESIKEEMW